MKPSLENMTKQMLAVGITQSVMLESCMSTCFMTLSIACSVSRHGFHS